jgi:hypothetical protein
MIFRARAAFDEQIKLVAELRNSILRGALEGSI